MKYIIDYIIVFTDWLITAIKDILLLLWNVILIVVEAGKFLISVVTSLPALVTVPAVALVVACVLYKVLGREGGEDGRRLRRQRTRCRWEQAETARPRGLR